MTMILRIPLPDRVPNVSDRDAAVGLHPLVIAPLRRLAEEQLMSLGRLRGKRISAATAVFEKARSFRKARIFVDSN
jgi:hypothetical protein